MKDMVDRADENFDELGYSDSTVYGDKETGIIDEEREKVQFLTRSLMKQLQARLTRILCSVFA